MYKHPGVYIEELPSGVIPIEAASTSIAAIIGPVRRGPVNEPRFITGVTQFEKDFGEMNDPAGGIRNFGGAPDYFGHAVHAFFGNGGKKAYIVRVADEAETSEAAIYDPSDPMKRAFYFKGKSEGIWGNRLIAKLAEVEPGYPSLKYKLDIGIMEEGEFISLENFPDLTFAEGDSKELAKVVNKQSALVSVERRPIIGNNSGGRTAALLSGRLKGFDFTQLETQTLQVTVDGSAVDVQFDDSVKEINSAAAFIQNAVRSKINANNGQLGFLAQVTDDNRLFLISGTRDSNTPETTLYPTSRVTIGNTPAQTLLLLDNHNAKEIFYPDGGKRTGVKSGSLAGRTFYPLNGKKLKVVINGDVSKTVEVIFDDTVTDIVSAANFIQTKVRAADTTSAFTNFKARVQDVVFLVLVSGTPGTTGTVSITQTGSTAAEFLNLKTALGLTTIEYPDGDGNSALKSGSLEGVEFWPLSGKKLSIVVDGDTSNPISVSFNDSHRTLEQVRVKIQQAVRASSTGSTVSLGRAGFEAFISKDGSLLLVSGSRGPGSTVTLDAVSPSSDSAEEILKLLPAARQEHYLYHPVGGTSQFMAGEDGNLSLNKTHYDEAFKVLKDYRDVSIILLPGVSYDTNGSGIIDAAITHSETMKNRVVVVDPPSGTTFISPKSVKDAALPTSSHAALYYPWMEVPNPHFHPETAANLPSKFLVGASAFAAGIWARIDGRRGVWKAPAGLEATVRGSLGPSKFIGDDIQDNLNDLGINCIRSIIGPPVVWGARMLSTKSQPDFRYVPIRRTSAMIGESLYNALQAVVFEPNKHILWAALRSNIGNFMDGLFRAGAFQGEKASDAYFVRCNLGDTMTQADIDAGIVRVIVGYAALKPAEFVVIQLKQKVGQSTS